MSMRNEAIKFIKDAESPAEAAKSLLRDGPRSLVLYVLAIGINKLLAQDRHNTRQELKREIQPQFVQGPTTGSVRLSKATVARQIKIADRLFNEYKIGILSIANMTREELIEQAKKELSAARGSIVNYKLYNAWAEPMQPGQRVRDYWRPAEFENVRTRILAETREFVPA